MSRILPVRTSANLNTSSDINKLSEQALDKEGTSQLSVLVEDVSPAGADLLLLEKVAGGLKKVKISNVGGGGPQGIPFNLTGVLVVGIKQAQILMPGSATIEKVIIYSETQPTGSSIIIDIMKNGVTIFTTPSKRPEIAVGTNTDDSDTPDITGLVQDDRVRVDVIQKGSTIPGGDDLMVTIVFA